MKTKKEDKQNAKDRIYMTALSLFAQKGFNAVGIREIAKSANVNISMINYYFGGKLGILKEVVNEHRQKYYDAIHDTGDETMPMLERARVLVNNLVNFYRSNLEVALVGAEAMITEIPEIAELQHKWFTDNRKSTDGWFVRLGLKLDDIVQMSVIRYMLTAIVHAHFEQEYVWQRVIKAPVRPRFIDEHDKKSEEQCCEISDDEFYKRYSETLADFYIHGIHGITDKNEKGG
jgi:AcrR family transcriptional regulator